MGPSLNQEALHATAVVISAYNAADTIATAVRSAGSQPETTEIVVVDDASNDGTADAAAQAAEQAGCSGRLQILRNPTNLGPAESRNCGIAASTAPFIAVLDADDAFLPGRLAALHAVPSWDMIADDVMFVANIAETPAPLRAGPSPRVLALDLEQFVKGNRVRPGRNRGELGFLKPVFRRSFLHDKGMTYRSDMRLGEDFEFLARALAGGARMLIVERCGYAALVRPNSLSAAHRTEDLARFSAATRDMLADLPSLSDAERRALLEHLDCTIGRWLHRRFLDIKRDAGIVRALRAVPTTALPGIADRILRDKLSIRRSVNSARVDGLGVSRTLLGTDPYSR